MGNRAQKSGFWLAVTASVLFVLTGCEDSARTPVQVRPAQIALPSQDPVLTPLPLNAQHKSVTPLVVAAPYGAKQLAVESQAAVDAGATGEMVEQVRQTLRDVAPPMPEEEIGRGARWHGFIGTRHGHG